MGKMGVAPGARVLIRVRMPRTAKWRFFVCRAWSVDFSKAVELDMKCIEVTIWLFLAAVVSAKPPNMVFMLMDDVRIASTSYFIIKLTACI